jgi:hypothetical protein
MGKLLILFFGPGPAAGMLMKAVEEVLRLSGTGGHKAQQGAQARIRAQGPQVIEAVAAGRDEGHEAFQVSAYHLPAFVAQRIAKLPVERLRHHGALRFDDQGETGVGGHQRGPAVEEELEPENALSYRHERHVDSLAWYVYCMILLY